MKMTTPIPPQITTPDVAETRFGPLRFSNGMPDAATIEAVRRSPSQRVAHYRGRSRLRRSTSLPAQTAKG